MVDEQLLAAKLRDVAPVVVIATGRATWLLTEALSRNLSVHHGYVRVWMPRLRCSSPESANPRIQIDCDREADAVASRVLLAARFGLRLGNDKCSPRAPAGVSGPARSLVKTGGSGVPFDPQGPLADVLGWQHGDSWSPL
ncbi:MAG: hypothetical protein WBO45_18180 [Planctomycetota bacterium]